MKILAPTTTRAFGSGGDVFTAEGVAPEVLMVYDSAGTGPCCAHFVQRGECSLGRDCPFRHAQPGPNDKLREPIDLSRKETLKPIDRKGI